jgi:GNAT superfamily N-acetyltransferase
VPLGECGGAFGRSGETASVRGVVGAVVRRATVSDVPRLAELRRGWTCEEDSPDATLVRGDFDAAFARLVSDGIETGRWVVWVAEVGGEIVSHAFVGVIDKIPRPVAGFPAIGYLTNVYTRPEFRGQGLGSRVLDAVTAWARNSDIELLVVWPSDASVAHYERHGFADRGEPLVWRHPDHAD